MLNIVAMLHNQTTNTYHPIYFSASPFPGDQQPKGAERYRSRGHHTAGFPNRDDAVAHAKDELAPKLDATCALAGDIEWDGKECPALTMFFGTVDGEIKPLL